VHEEKYDWKGRREAGGRTFGKNQQVSHSVRTGANKLRGKGAFGQAYKGVVEKIGNGESGP